MLASFEGPWAPPKQNQPKGGSPFGSVPAPGLMIVKSELRSKRIKVNSQTGWIGLVASLLV
jgi:hypothetical protein